jgi:hypothetical protein
MSIISGATPCEVRPPNPFDFGARWQTACLAKERALCGHVLTEAQFNSYLR